MPSITDATQVHIHVGAAGVNGDVVVFLFGPADPAVGSISTSGRIPPADLLGPLAGNWDGFVEALDGSAYVNVRTAALPAGGIRGQIAPAAAPVGGLPNTGSDGLADTTGDGVVAWQWAVIAASAMLLVSGAGFAYQRTR